MKQKGKREKNKLKLECFNYKKKDHFAHECIELKKVLSGHSHFVFVISHMKVVYFYPVWIVDLRVIEHIALD